MRVKVSELVGFFLVLAGLCFSAQSAQAEYFTFVVCNQSSVPASVAVASYVTPTDQRFEVQGWGSVAPGTCATMGTFPQGWFYYYAEETNTQAIVWPGTAVNLCVDYPGPFQRIDTPNYTCQPNEVLRGFSGSEIPSNMGTFTWNLN